MKSVDIHVSLRQFIHVLIGSHNFAIISIIFKSFLANGIFPDDWKSARFTPLF